MQILPRSIPFYKLQGSGNDFVILFNDALKISRKEMPDWAKKICPRAFSVGADGLIFLEKSQEKGLDYVWHFFNADGSRAEMCGNGARCAAKLACLSGLAPHKHIFGTDAGPISAEVDKHSDLVKVQLTPPRDMQLNITLTIEDKTKEVHFVNTGVPHTVLFTDQADREDISRIGPAIRRHNAFAPQGTNVNLVQIKGPDFIQLRTYERGVEDETFACGTGAVAAVAIASALGKVKSRVKVITSGKEELIISIEDNQFFLQGKAILVYKGALNPEILQAPLPGK